MKAVVQRVESCVLSVAGQEVARIGTGLVCYLGVGQGDTEEDLDWMAKKVARLRIFPDADDRMNRSAADEGFAILVVPQFTLFGDIRHGYRPSFSGAEAPERARAWFETFLDRLRVYGIGQVAAGVFGADMTIAQVNRGPVTILLDSRS
ncbi:MAG: D-tyrosyl-tRNA(Tyr) deacylase [Candidatus Ozemobacter sibiricus]|jgi:D-tyrosyl-tRNA(Tyr) deacylase|uniref:D-aminoacyl-tRNA deacylase n=1 Tax=Candidatus Ozemobacter sibiricus TaxID=2268124 RepID=A0A367ZK64_9BACT|nr:MAG: D-tyrosyl-tRNA(Tyr) deacylase [Candidatus Ozemobacter sibiricus]